MDFLDQAFAATNQDYLPCEFKLISKPDITHTGKLYRNQVHQRAELHGEDGVVVKLRATPDSLEGITPHSGAEVIADIKCGKKSFAFVWLHEPIEWLRTYVLF